METWYTADLHLGHANVIEYCARPFGSVDEMDDALLTAWNETVAPHDVVWVLGDLAMGRIGDSLALPAQLHGNKHLLAGNHDRVFPGNHRRPEAWTGRYEQAGFELHQGSVTLDVGGTQALACTSPTRATPAPTTVTGNDDLRTRGSGCSTDMCTTNGASTVGCST